MTNRFWIICTIIVSSTIAYVAQAQAQQGGCYPKCRAGFICSNDKCVSMCNPPCASGETCTAQGACAAVAVKQPPRDYYVKELDPNWRRHTGFFLRFTFGPGWSHADAPYQVDDSGFSLLNAFDVGAAVIENLVVHLRLGGLGNYGEKSVKLDFGEKVATKKTAIYYGLLGLGVTYYFMPVNLYTTFALGLAGCALQIDERDLDSDMEVEGSKPGLGLNFDIGKEWWIGSEWGLGAAGRFTFSSVGPNKSSKSDNRLKNVGFGLLFSVTYN